MEFEAGLEPFGLFAVEIDALDVRGFGAVDEAGEAVLDVCMSRQVS